MAKDDESRIGRRALIAAGVGGAAVAAVQALEAPGSVLGAQGGNAIIGAVNEGTDRTVFKSTQSDGVEGMSQVPTKSGVYGVNSNNSGYGVFGRNAALNVTGYLGGPGHGAWGETGVEKYSGVYGRATNGNAYGVSGSHVPSGNMGRLGDAVAGVEGQAKVGDGVKGETTAANKSGVYGVGGDATGYGVYGYNAKNGATGHLGGPVVGVEGISPGGDMKGQLGTTDAGAYGVHGPTKNAGWVGASGAGLVGVNGSNGSRGEIGGYAAGIRAFGAASVPALQVIGSVVLIRSGVAAVPKGKTSVQVSEWKAQGAVEVAIAVPIAYRPGIGVAATIVDGAKGTVTIYLTKAAPSNTPVAFFLFGRPPA